MNKLEIHHTTTSPHHHQSNGLADVYVKISKAFLQKAKDTNEDPHIAMTVYGTTPFGPNQPSPVDLIHWWKGRSDLPFANAGLKTSGIMSASVKSTHNQQKADKNQLKEGQYVMYKTPPEKTWKKAVVPKYLGHRSYLIHAKDGAVYRHIRYHLKPFTP